jgi:hypothetical protein
MIVIFGVLTQSVRRQCAIIGKPALPHQRHAACSETWLKGSDVSNTPSLTGRGLMFKFISQRFFSTWFKRDSLH